MFIDTLEQLKEYHESKQTCHIFLAPELEEEAKKRGIEQYDIESPAYNAEKYGGFAYATPDDIQEQDYYDARRYEDA